MNSVSLLLKYFPNLSELQISQFSQLLDLYTHWNAQINVISRKDLDHFYERHVLHALAIGKVIQFTPGTQILDVGTGGGFPGIPLAILFPECNFTLVDSIGKKIKVVNEVASALELTNLQAHHDRAENIPGTFDFVVSRAVTAMPAFIPWIKDKFKKEQKNEFPNGILYLKGGDLTEEMASVQQSVTYFPISDLFQEDFFETKQVVYVKMKYKGEK